MHNGARSKDAGRGERGAAARAAHRAAGEAGGGAGGGGPLVTVPGVQVRVPGSTSNVGAGFDCVGIAIERRLSGAFRVDGGAGGPVRVERRGTLQAVTVPSDRDWLFAGFVAACRGAGCKVPGGVMIDAASEIPIGRGLGSSGAATVAGALAARALLGLELDDAALARLCADVEHHPDNVAPAIYGGAVLAVPGPQGRLALPPPPGRPPPRLGLVDPRGAPRVRRQGRGDDEGAGVGRARRDGGDLRHRTAREPL